MEQSNHYSKVKSLIIMITLLILAVATWSWYYTNYEQGEGSGQTVHDNQGNNDEQQTPAQTYTSDKGEQIEITLLELTENGDREITIEGSAPEGWAFEGSFPIELRSHGGRQPVAESFAKAESNESDGRVSFSGLIEYEALAEDSEMVVILRHANPSALAENDDEVEISL